MGPNYYGNDNDEEKKKYSWSSEHKQKVPLCPLQYSILKLFMNVKQLLTWSYSQDDIDDDDINDDDDIYADQDDQDDGFHNENDGRNVDDMNLTMSWW